MTEEEIIESGTGGKGLEKAVEEMWKEDREEKKKKKEAIPIGFSPSVYHLIAFL